MRHDGAMRRAVATVLGLLAHAVFGATIRVSPDAGYQPIEAAQPGDEVVLAPGTYRFRLALTVSGTPSNPIVIRGEDPTQPPLFDYSGADLQSFPGSNAGFHPGRGAWDVIGSDLEFRSIAFRGAVTVGPTAAAAIRFSSGERHRVSDLFVEGCEGGVENVAGSLLVENSRFHRNGTHFPMFGGGPFTARGNLLTDATEWNYYLAGGDALFEANWMSRSGGFAGLIDACAYVCGGTGVQPVARDVVFRGNVFVQSATQLPNSSFFFGVLGSGNPSADGTGLTQPNVVTFSHNTFVGALPTPTTAMLINAGAAHQTKVRAFGNAWTGFATLMSELSAMPAALETAGNWAADGTDTTGFVFVVTGPATSLSPTLRPVSNSSLFGVATTDSTRVPRFEFSADESGLPGVVPRASATTAGAFESSRPVAPDGGGGDVDGGASDVDGGASDVDGGAGDVEGGAPSGGDSASDPGGTPGRRNFRVGCGATLESALTFPLLMVLLLRRRARPPLEPRAS